MTRGTRRRSTDASPSRTPLLENMSTVGIVLALTISALGQAVALAALIFAGPLQVGLHRASSNFMLAAAIGIAVIGWRSKLVPSMSTSQDGPAVVMVAVAAGLAGGTFASPATDVLIAVGLVTVASAIAMALVAHFGLGSVVRYLPTTVVSGFVAGTGWLLSKGGFDIMMSHNLGLSDLAALIGPAQVKFWIPGLVLSGAIPLGARSAATTPYSHRSGSRSHRGHCQGQTKSDSRGRCHTHPQGANAGPQSYPAAGRWGSEAAG